MPTKVKINISDNRELREQIDAIYEKADQVSLAKWSLSIAKHILEIVDINYKYVDEIINGFKVNE